MRHYYLRQNPWEGDIQIQLLDKSERQRSSHQIAEAARALLTPIAQKLKAKIQVVEMPPGPPVLQSMVAEVHGPDDATRKAAAWKITEAFEKAQSVVDVDNYIPAPHNTLSFVVDRRKAESNGISVGEITEQLTMVMGGYKLGDVKKGAELEPRFIVLQVPLSVRSQVSRMLDTPIVGKSGKLIPLGELGTFVEQPQDSVIYHKDLRSVEYVIGETSGVVTGLAAPIYGMLEVQRYLQDYVPPGNTEGMWPHYFGAPANDFQASYEWTGEWTVTYETFRDMGLAFMAALILIYMLVVWEFGNFRLPGIIMAPIPLTLIGIIPGHWLMNAEFTATSMIGWIALAGIIVRNSILLVDFSKHEVERGVPLREAVIQSVRTRTRPILITALALVAGSFSILQDPIFQGMAISLLFGAIVSTILTLFVIPLACVRAPGAYKLPEGGGEAVCAPAAVTAARAEAQASAGGLGASAGETATARKSGSKLVAAGAMLAAIGSGAKQLDRLTGHPFANLLSTPYLIWTVVSNLLRDGLGAFFGPGRPGGEPEKGGSTQTRSSSINEPGGAGQVASFKSEATVRPGRFVKSEKLEAETTTGAIPNAQPFVSEISEPQEPMTGATTKAIPATEDGHKDDSPANRAQRANGAAEPVSVDHDAPVEPQSEHLATVEEPAAVVSSSVRDDLKEINGIGPKIEKMLNEHGITTFVQLAEFDPTQASSIVAVVDLAGRMEREDWRGQARKLMKVNG